MRGSRRFKTILALIGTAAMVLMLGGIAGAASGADPRYPDLPKRDAGGSFYGTLTDQLAFVSGSQQYAKIDDARVGIDMNIRRLPPEPGSTLQLSYPLRAYVIDGEHDIPQTFGIFPDTRVRTVAFGAVPVEATIRVSQLRDTDGLLVPLDIQGEITTWLRNAGPHPNKYESLNYHVIADTTLNGRVTVAISDVTVDGVPVDVGATCHTVEPAQLSAVGDGYVSEDYADLPPGVQIPPGKFNPALGGEMDGSIDIPAFSGCTSGSDDLGPLLTVMVSGENLPLTVLVSDMIPTCFNNDPAQSSLAACKIPNLPIPKRPK